MVLEQKTTQVRYLLLSMATHGSDDEADDDDIKDSVSKTRIKFHIPLKYRRNHHS